jgi:MFS family permease
MRFQWRFAVASLLFVAEGLCYLDRVSIAVAVVHFRMEGMDETRIGLVLASFFWGYVVSQVPSGIAAAKFGGHVILCVALCGWGLCTLVSSMFPLLLVSRVCLGVFEGCIFPAVYTVIARWTPLQEKTRVSAAVTSGQEIGTIFALGASPFLANAISWRALFYLYGGITLAFAPLLVLLSSSFPEHHRFIGVDEKSFIVANRAPYVPSSVKSVPWKLFLVNKPYIVLCFGKLF